MTDAGPDSVEFEALAKMLETSPDHRVIRRLRPRPPTLPPEGAIVRTGLFVDTETTGLDPASDEIIELAMVPFTYGEDDEIYAIGKPFQALREPSRPISPEITAITGITNDMVAGATIEVLQVEAFVAPAAVIIAHNAGFDRRFLERLSTAFTTKPWACSMVEMDWQAQGYEGVKLAYLASQAGFFYERHRATEDCLAALELLARPLANGEKTGLSHLLEKARTPSWRIWAENAPFEFKDHLKARGYRWNPGDSGTPRAWYIDRLEADVANELDFLRKDIYGGDIDPLVRRIDAFDRYSDRC